MFRRAHLVSLATAAFAAVAVQAQVTAPAPAEEPALAVDLREELVRIPVTVKDLYNRQETREIPLAIYRPAGEGPFPLVIYNHGRATTERRAQQGRSRPESFARFMVRKGFAVIAPTRVGYAETYGDFDPEASGSCQTMQPEPMSIAASEQVLAAWAFARTQADIDTSRWLVAGTSVGGLTAIATVWRNPPGLLGGINFSGGAGGNPDRNPGKPCSPHHLEQLWRDKAPEARVPMLWLYWENDLYWGAAHPKAWYEAWTGQGAKAEFHQLPAVGRDGHAGFAINMDGWVPIVERYLAGLGFDRTGVPNRPVATSFATVTEIDKVPLPERTRDTVYTRFLGAKAPRALAIGERGSVGWATGDWALAKALGFCERRGDTCRLYAVDDDVVWTPR